MNIHTWFITPLFVYSSADGDTLREALISWNAAKVSLICRLMIARPSSAGLKAK